MKEIITELLDRQKEAKILFDFISDMSKDSKNILLSPILKSSFILLLYNSIEAILTLTLERVHEVVTNTPYKDLSISIKDIWLDYILASKKSCKKEINKLIDGEAVFPSFFNCSKQKSLYSGNIDGKLLHDLMEKYGIGCLCTPDRHRLLYIKNKRNKLAHGEEAFKTASRDLTISDLESLNEACFSALNSLVNQTQTFFEKFKETNKI